MNVRLSWIAAASLGLFVAMEGCQLGGDAG